MDAFFSPGDLTLANFVRSHVLNELGKNKLIGLAGRHRWHCPFRSGSNCGPNDFKPAEIYTLALGEEHGDEAETVCWGAVRQRKITVAHIYSGSWGGAFQYMKVRSLLERNTDN